MKICSGSGSGSGVVFCEYTPRSAETRTIGSIIIENEQKKKRVITDFKTEIDAESRTRNIESITQAIDQKMKRVIIDNPEIGLHVKVINVKGIDDPSLHPLVQSRHYNVVCYVEPDGKMFRTTMMEGFINLSWDEFGMITLENPDDHRFLNVEVQRFNSWLEPGTSIGKVVVGRAKIPFPKELYHEIKVSIELVRAQEEGYKPEGQITIAMRLERLD